MESSIYKKNMNIPKFRMYNIIFFSLLNTSLFQDKSCLSWISQIALMINLLSINLFKQNKNPWKWNLKKNPDYLIFFFIFPPMSPVLNDTESEYFLRIHFIQCVCFQHFSFVIHLMNNSRELLILKIKELFYVAD